MDHCTRCRTRLDGAPNCPSCGVPAAVSAELAGDAASSPAAATREAREEPAYVAKPFHQEPPPDVDPDPEPATERNAPTRPARPDDVEAGASRQETTRLEPVVPAGARVQQDGGGEDDFGGGDGEDDLPGDDDHRPRRRRRIIVLAAALCAVLLGVVAFQFGGEEGIPDRPAEESVAPTNTPERTGPSPSEPSADASTAEPSTSAPAEPTTSAPQAPVQPQPEQTAPGAEGPTTPPPPATPTTERPEPTSPAPDPSDDCILILCL